MSNIKSRLKKLEELTPEFEVRFGCVPARTGDEFKLELEGNTRVIVREKDEPEKEFQARVKREASDFNRATYPTATVIIEAEDQNL